MLQRGYDRKGSVAKEKSSCEGQWASRQNELFRGKPPVVKHKEFMV
jgi:hypothetical protein